MIFETPHHLREKPKRKPSPRTGVWVRLLEPLKKHRGEWVKLRKMGSPRSAQVTAAQLQAGGQLLVPKGRYQYASSAGWVYARYLG